MISVHEQPTHKRLARVFIKLREDKGNETMRKWDLSHTVDEKVLMHLWDHSTLKDEREAPFEVTQHGIAAAVGIIRSAVPRSVKKLVEKGYIYRQTVTRTIDGKPKSRRVIKWIRFGIPANQRVERPQNGGSGTRQTDEKHPQNSGPTINNYNKNYNMATPTPLPAKWPASALQNKRKTEKHKMTPEQLEQEKKRQVKALREDELR